MSAAALSAAYFEKQPTEKLIAARDLVSDILDFRARQHSLFEPPPVLVPKPAPVAPIVNEGVPAALSPSSVNCFQDCSAKYYYRKILQLPEQRTGALALGSAVHEAVAVNFAQKIETGVDLPYASVRTVFRDSLLAQLDSAVLSESETPGELMQCGDALVQVYMAEAAPSIQPAAVELAVEGTIGGVAVHGFVDVLTVDGTVVDLKTASKKPSGISPAHRLQVATYSMLAPGASGRGRLDTITKTKTVGHHSTTFEVTPADRKYTETLYSITRDQISTGLFVPNRSSFLCSRKNCSFWRECEDSFGGQVCE